jgi:hypothetical protein
VGMGQQDGMEGFRGAPERLPVPAKEIPFLEKPAVHEESGASRCNQITGTGHIAGGAHEGQIDVQRRLLYFLS